MPRPKVGDAEIVKDFHFPKVGIDLSMGFSRQPNRPVLNGEYARSTPFGLNVRGFEASSNRLRGGSRPGLVQYIPALVSGTTFIVQDLNTVVGTRGTGVQLSQSGRVVTLVAVSQGQVYTAVPGAITWTLAANLTGETPPLNFTGLMFSTSLNQKLYFADGINQAYYDPGDNTVHKWVATAGTLPVDSANNTPRLICTWRGRIVQSGLLLDPQDVFMSAVSDPNNWDYSPQSTSPTQAVALSANSPTGLVGDVVTTLIPYTDDVLVIGGDHTIYMMQGDPMAGGQLDLVSDIIGMAWGMPWCKDPYGAIYFVSNRTGIYTMVPGQQPQRISQGIEQLLATIDTGANGIRLVWDDRFQGLHVFVTPLAAPGPATHFFYELRAGAWWTDSFANNNLNPLATCTLDGNTPGDRIPLVGSWDGYVRAISPSATTDDGTAINSEVWIGPILTPDSQALLVKDIQGILGVNSGAVTYEIHVGTSAEAAFNSPAVATGVFLGGRNLTQYTRWSGHASYIRLTSSNPWSIEAIRVRIAGKGKVQARNRL